MKKLWNEFKEFAFKGNVIDMTVGVILGTAITAVVTSLGTGHYYACIICNH